MRENERRPGIIRAPANNDNIDGTKPSSDDRQIDGPPMLAAATAYAARGWPVFPLKPRGKVPANSDGFKSAAADTDKIRRYWTAHPGANIGLATGSVSNLFVIDVDDLGAIDQLQEMHGVLPETLTAETGSGGRHLFFRHPESEVRNRAGVIRGIDVRGDGGYVVLAPSIHPNGNAYRWLSERAPANAPDWLLDLAVENATAQPRVLMPVRSFVGVGIGSPYGRAVLEGEVASVLSAVEGTRNHTLFIAACNCSEVSKGGELDPSSAWTALETAAERIGLTPREIRATLRSAFARTQPRAPMKQERST